jgi:putative membrane protein
MNSVLGRFLVRWIVCGSGIWLATLILGTNRIDYGNQLGVIVTAGLLLAVINTVIKPIVVLLSLPAILFSLGLFMIVINGLMLLLVSKLYSPLKITNFGAAMVAGMIIGLVNYIVTRLLERDDDDL